MKLKKHFENLNEKLKPKIVDDNKRIQLQNTILYTILAVVSLIMTVINAVLHKDLVLIATSVFCVLSVINIILSMFGQNKLSSIFFAVEFVALFTFFLVTGDPEGFSAIWICMLPTSGLLLFKRKNGSILCMIMFIILVVCLWTPLNGYLLFDYSASFKLRFPILFLVFFVISYIFEYIRSLTYEELQKTQNSYKSLYTHDALTGLHNRYGFNIAMDKLLKRKGSKGLIMLDIDYFKSINDNFGHDCGDEAIKEMGRILSNQIGDNGEVCHWGGDEFVALVFDGNKAKDLAENISNYVKTNVLKYGKQEVKFTVSIGVAYTSVTADIDSDKFLRMADKCLYQAKEDGKNRIDSIYIEE